MVYTQSNILTAEEIYQRCQVINEHVNKEIDDFAASWRDDSNDIPIQDDDKAMRKFLHEKIRGAIRERIGQKKCDALFNHIEGQLKTAKEKFNLGIAVYKLSMEHNPLSLLQKMSQKDFQSLLKIIDCMIKNEPEPLEEQYRHIDQHENVYRQEKSSTIESFADKIKASVGESDGVMGAAKGALKFLKEKISPGEKTEKSSDKIMMDLLSSPVNAVLVCFVLCIIGSGGWAPFAVSTQLITSGLGFLRGSVSDSTAPGIYNPIGTSGNRLPPKLFTGTEERQESGELYQSSKKTFADREQERKCQQSGSEELKGSSPGFRGA
ncbi:MAG: hypothetical protein ACTJLK_04635 [Anaplasma sp.]